MSYNTTFGRDTAGGSTVSLTTTTTYLYPTSHSVRRGDTLLKVGGFIDATHTGDATLVIALVDISDRSSISEIHKEEISVGTADAGTEVTSSLAVDLTGSEGAKLGVIVSATGASIVMDDFTSGNSTKNPEIFNSAYSDGMDLSTPDTASGDDISAYLQIRVFEHDTPGMTMSGNTDLQDSL